ncbi:MAG: hypothetical protein Q8Q49_01275 [bacterium]|nr:hypothetical protein [bacterium]
MEIASLPKSSVRIKGKRAVVVINPAGKTDGNASIFIEGTTGSKYSVRDGVIIASPGEYEVAGMKIKGSQIDETLTFSLSVDSVDVLLGKLSSFEKSHSKLSEHDVVLVDVDTLIDPSFLSSLSSHVILLTGEKAKEVVNTFMKDNVITSQKFSSTKEKLPQEVETILLSV